MMDAGFFLVLAQRLNRLAVPVAIDGNCDFEVREDFRLSCFMEEGFYRHAASEYEMPQHWQNFIIRVMDLLFHGEINDLNLLRTLRILAECEGIKWEFLFRIFGAETGCQCGIMEVARECHVDHLQVIRQVSLLIEHKDEILEK